MGNNNTMKNPISLNIVLKRDGEMERWREKEKERKPMIVKHETE
jgi:hypothetical protein